MKTNFCNNKKLLSEFRRVQRTWKQQVHLYVYVNEGACWEISSGSSKSSSLFLSLSLSFKQGFTPRTDSLIGPRSEVFILCKRDRRTYTQDVNHKFRTSYRLHVMGHETCASFDVCTLYTCSIRHDHLIYSLYTNFPYPDKCVYTFESVKSFFLIHYCYCENFFFSIIIFFSVKYLNARANFPWYSECNLKCVSMCSNRNDAMQTSSSRGSTTL